MTRSEVSAAGGEAQEIVVEVYGSALGASPGAEIVGVVVEAGAAASELLGRPVLVPRLLPCGICGLCQRGRVASCPHLHRRGGLVERERVPARFVVPLGPPLFEGAVDMSGLWRYAALPDALGAPHGGLLRAGLCPGEMVAVLSGPGAGFRAAGAALVLQALGCKGVVLSPDGRERAALAAPPFDMEVLDSTALDAESAQLALRELARGLGVTEHGLCVLEVTGTDVGRERALGMVSRGGAAVLLGRLGPAHAGQSLPSPVKTAALERLVEEQGTVIGAGAPHPDLLPELVALVHRAGVALDELVEEVAPRDVDRVIVGRRRGDGASVRLPVVRFR